MKLTQLLRICDADFWSMNQPYNAIWDKHLNRLMDMGEGTQQATMHCNYIGTILVWTSNFPYAYGSPYVFGSQETPEHKPISCRPSRLTILRLRDYLREKQGERTIDQQVKDFIYKSTPAKCTAIALPKKNKKKK